MPSVRRASVPIYALATAIVIHLVIVLVLYEECVYVCVQTVCEPDHISKQYRSFFFNITRGR